MAECLILRGGVKAPFGCVLLFFCEIQADRGRCGYIREHYSLKSRARGLMINERMLMVSAGIVRGVHEGGSR